MRLAHLKIALFLIFLAAPVGSIALLGSAESFGREQPAFPKIGEMTRAKARDQLGEAVLERTAVMKRAVQLNDWIGYRVFGFVSSPVAISGKDGWLFYRPELQNGACFDLQHVADQLQRVHALIEMARASGLDFRISLSPNKSTIYPDFLHPYFRGYWRCNAKNVAGVRALLKQHAPLVIDHAVPLLAERIGNPGTQLYYVADTHWTPYGGAIALRQLLTTLYPEIEIPMPRLTDAAAKQVMDLASALQLPIEKQASDVAPLPQDVLDRLNRNSANVRTLIIHDSFYGRISAQVQAALPHAIMVRGTRERGWINEQIAAADRLIVNLVERDLVRVVTEGMLDWKAGISTAIIARSQRLAEQCGSFEGAHAGAGGLSDGNGKGNATIVAVRAVEPEKSPCLRISLMAGAPTVVTVALPDASGALVPDRLVKFRVNAGSQTVGLVLPRDVSGGRVALGIAGIGESATLSAIEIGEISRPHLAGAAQGGDAAASQP